MQLLDKLSKLNERLEDILSRLGELETKLATVSAVSRTPSHQNMASQVSAMSRTLSQQNIALQASSSIATAPSSHGSGYANGPASAVGVTNSSTTDSLLLEEVYAKLYVFFSTFFPCSFSFSFCLFEIPVVS